LQVVELTRELLKRKHQAKQFQEELKKQREYAEKQGIVNNDKSYYIKSLKKREAKLKEALDGLNECNRILRKVETEKSRQSKVDDTIPYRDAVGAFDEKVNRVANLLDDIERTLKTPLLAFEYKELSNLYDKVPENPLPPIRQDHPFKKHVVEAFSHPDSHIEFVDTITKYPNGSVRIPLIIHIPAHVHSMYDDDWNRKDTMTILKK
jgi:seryl-tRNA synthetase